MSGCGTCRQGYTSVYYCNDFGVVPMLVRPKEFVDFHKEHDARGSDSGSRMERERAHKIVPMRLFFVEREHKM